ncbi:hypothetical protein QAD02_001813 [Eretmocerus hayati]|uniref:Uncharacterized protein n=1 Tax=Eretmocerus hayati TaxID=131215 RepID=A0ACC2NH35_9HYME|nr:hypothetical protein QAD02_001813 [Eretmocerus hayati]
MKMYHRLWSLPIFLLLGLTLGAGGVELTFELPDNAKECFYQEVDKNVTATLEFQVVTGGQYDVDVTLEAPNGEVVYRQVKTQFDSHTFTPTISGVYKACFSNEFSTFSHKLVYMDFQVGEEMPLPGLGEHITALTQMETSAQEIHKSLNSILDYQTHHRLREAQGRKRAEDLNERVQMWSVLETVAIIVTSLGQEQDIPIDINTGKLLEWLINRRHCQRDWQAHVLKIREKINNAIQDMPVHEEIAKLLTGTHINYFHCKKIVEILKETEADTKNLFGRYGSQRMKDWLEIIRLYEKDNIYLAEAAQMLIRNVNYEVPGLKKQIQKIDQTRNELEKRESEYKKSENIARSEFNNLCKQLGIPGYKIKKELMERIKELPELYEKVTTKFESLKNVVEFYSAFVQFTLGNEHDGNCVPILKYLIDKGNTTTYEWTYGEAPLSINEPNFDVGVDVGPDSSDENDATIDFGDSKPDEINFGDLSLDGEIDFGNDIQLEHDGGDIDWGAVEDEARDPAGSIDFEISLEESGIVVEGGGNDGGIATGSLALRILDNPEIRTDVIDQLLELEAFLKLRLYECKNDDDKNLLNMSQMQELPILQLATLESTQNMLDSVQVVISEILDSKLQHLHNIKHSPRYVDVLSSNLKQKQKMIVKTESLQQVTRNKQEEMRQQAIALQPVLKIVIQKTKELQSEIEKDISKKYNNRKVKLTGGVNTL